jgi:hypothetical protein
MADVRLGRPRFHQNGVLCTVDRATTIFGWANGAAATQFRFASTHFQASNSSTKRVLGSVRTTRFYTEFQRPEHLP